MSASWRRELLQWLRISYLERGDHAAFGIVDDTYLRVPSLYATRAALGISRLAGWEVDGGKRIGAWIASLQGPHGAFDDPRNNAPGLIETYWAIDSLHALGVPIAHPRAVIDFLRSCMDDRGRFSMECGHDPMESDEQGRVTAAYFALSILERLGTSEAGLDLEATTKWLQAYARGQAASGLPELADDSAGYLVAALTGLAIIGRRTLPKFAAPYVSKLLADISALSGTAYHVTLANRVLQAAERLDLLEDSWPNRQARVWWNERVIANTAQITGSANTKMEATLTYHLVELAARLGVAHPDIDNIERLLRAHRIRDGWAVFVNFAPASDATFYAVQVAQAMGRMDEFNIAKLSRRACAIARTGRLPEEEATRASVADLFYAFQTCSALTGRFDAELAGKVRAHALRRIRALPDEAPAWTAQQRAELIDFARLAVQLGFSPEGPGQQRLQAAVDMLVELLETGNGMKQLHAFYLVESALQPGSRVPPHAQLMRQRVLSLRARAGRFLRTPGAPGPDLESTWLATDILRGIHDDVRKKAIRKLVDACRTSYGFAYFPRAVREALPATSAHASLKSTYLGLRLLELLEPVKDQSV